MLLFRLCSTSDVGQTGQWTQTLSTTPLQPIKWNVSFWIMFTSDDQLGWSMDSNPIHHPSPANKMKYSFLDYIQLLMISWAGRWTQTPFTTPLQPKKWNACFWITYTSDDLPGLLMNLNPICHPSPTKKMKCSIFDYVQLLMISQTGQWTQTPSASPLQPKTWNAHFCITFNLWFWPDWSMDSNPIHHPSTAKKMKCFFYGLRSTSYDWLGWVMDSNPIHQPHPAKKMKCSFLDCIHFWWSAGLVDELEPHLPLLSSQ